MSASSWGPSRSLSGGEVAGQAQFGGTLRQHAEGFAPPMGLGDTPVLPWIGDRVAAGRIVRLGRIADLPREAQADSNT